MVFFFLKKNRLVNLGEAPKKKLFRSSIWN